MRKIRYINEEEYKIAREYSGLAKILERKDIDSSLRREIIYSVKKAIKKAFEIGQLRTQTDYKNEAIIELKRKIKEILK